MDNNFENIIDGFRSVCVDNIRALKANEAVFIYKDDVFFETLALCNKENIDVFYDKIDDYYIVKNKLYDNVKHRMRKR